jgi:hypothetical protein
MIALTISTFSVFFQDNCLSAGKFLPLSFGFWSFGMA